MVSTSSLEIRMTDTKKGLQANTGGGGIGLGLEPLPRQISQRGPEMCHVSTGSIGGGMADRLHDDGDHGAQLVQRRVSATTKPGTLLSVAS